MSTIRVVHVMHASPSLGGVRLFVVSEIVDPGGAVQIRARMDECKSQVAIVDPSVDAF